MEILYYSEEWPLSSTWVIVTIVACIFFVVSLILFMSDKKYVGCAVFIVAFLMFTCGALGILTAEPEHYVYARISPDASYTKIVKDYKYIDNHKDIYKLQIKEE